MNSVFLCDVLFIVIIRILHLMTCVVVALMQFSCASNVTTTEAARTTTVRPTTAAHTTETVTEDAAAEVNNNRPLLTSPQL